MSGPQYFHLKPRELRVDRYGDVAVVTFMLDGVTGATGSKLPTLRRTLVFVLEQGNWKVAHFHGSTAGAP